MTSEGGPTSIALCPVPMRSHPVTWRSSREPADAVATVDLVSGSGWVALPVFLVRESGRMVLCSGQDLAHTLQSAPASEDEDESQQRGPA